MAVLDTLRTTARRLKAETLALSIAVRDPRTPWYARVVVTLVVIYALSPIDLIPDFIPVLGYLDDLMLVPLGIALAIRLIPAEVLAESRVAAREQSTPPSKAGMFLVFAIWAITAALIVRVVLAFVS